MEILQLGEVQVSRVVEVENGPFTAATELIPDSDPRCSTSWRRPS